VSHFTPSCPVAGGTARHDAPRGLIASVVMAFPHAWLSVRTTVAVPEHRDLSSFDLHQFKTASANLKVFKSEIVQD
jgi:hypothetical protein